MQVVSRKMNSSLVYKTTKNKFVTKKMKIFNINIKSLVLVVLLYLFTLSSCAQKTISEASLDQKIGQMLIIGFRGFEAPSQHPISQAIKKYHIGGVVLFDYDVPTKSPVRNIQSPSQLKSLNRQLQSYAKIPLFITVDQEGGKVARLKQGLGFPQSVSAEYLGKLNNTDSTQYYAKKTARTLKEIGINTNLAPVIDVNINPENPVIGSLNRSFSANPETVAKHAKIYIDGLHKYNIITTLKHFPGHGSSEDDSHKGIVDVTKTWQKKELNPYKELINSGKTDIIMTAHIYNENLDSTYPATLSKPIITGILRDSLAFKGVIMSDDMQMGAIRKYYGLKESIKLSLQAGVDILVFANNSIFDVDIAAKAHRIIKELIDEGALSEERITESYKRIMQLKKGIQ